jgi:hypothetical protein
MIGLLKRQSRLEQKTILTLLETIISNKKLTLINTN